MVVKQGRYGDFLGCSKYPECTSTQSLNSNSAKKPTGVKCPEKECDGEIVEKSSRKGKIFYGCDKFPKCKYAIWDKPVKKECPDCGAPFIVEKITKKKGGFLKCLNNECGYSESLKNL